VLDRVHGGVARMRRIGAAMLIPSWNLPPRETQGGGEMP
jgi:hypothetical protein